jgi:hypothetical protein
MRYFSLILSALLNTAYKRALKLSKKFECKDHKIMLEMNSCD